MAEIPSLFASRFENDICCGSISSSGLFDVFFEIVLIDVCSSSGRLLVGQNGGSVAWQRLNGGMSVVRDAHLQTTCAEWFLSGLVAFSAGSDSLIKIWDAEEDVPEEDADLISAVAVLSGTHKKAVLCVAAIGRGRSIVSGGRDGVVLWDVPSQKSVLSWLREAEVSCAVTGADDTAPVIVGEKQGRAHVNKKKKKGRKTKLYSFMNDRLLMLVVETL
jgi:WD40 repeat protein